MVVKSIVKEWRKGIYVFDEVFFYCIGKIVDGCESVFGYIRFFVDVV